MQKTKIYITLYLLIFNIKWTFTYILLYYTFNADVVIMFMRLKSASMNQHFFKN